MPTPSPPPPKSRAASPSGKASRSPPEAAPARLALRAAIDAAVAGLVARAAAEAWPITADHCFLRIAYDHAMAGRWDRHCDRPAWRHLPLDRLTAALAVLEDLLAGGRDSVRIANAASLAWRAQGRGK